jgi:hypothetical protein
LHGGRTRAQADDDHLHPLFDRLCSWFLNSRRFVMLPIFGLPQ